MIHVNDDELPSVGLIDKAGVCPLMGHGIRVARFGLFEAKKKTWPFFAMVGLEIF